jgi:hypothetical protein
VYGVLEGFANCLLKVVFYIRSFLLFFFLHFFLSFFLSFSLFFLSFILSLFLSFLLTFFLSFFLFSLLSFYVFKCGWCGYLWLSLYLLKNMIGKQVILCVCLAVSGPWCGPQGAWMGKLPHPDMDQLL